MAGVKGAVHYKAMGRDARDAMALASIEKILDNQHLTRKPAKLDPVRLKALELRYSRLRPVLSAVENTSVDATSKLSESDIMAKIALLIAKYPDLITRAQQLQAQLPVTIDADTLNVAVLMPDTELSTGDSNTQ